MTIVSVFAKQNPFDRMISVRGRKKNKMRIQKKKKEEAGKQLHVICSWHDYEMGYACDTENLHRKAETKSLFHSF